MSELRNWKGAAERLGVKEGWLRSQSSRATARPI